MNTLIAGVPSVIWLGVIMALTTFTNDYLSAYPWATYVLAGLGAIGIALKTYVDRQQPAAPTSPPGTLSAPQARLSFVAQWLFGA